MARALVWAGLLGLALVVSFGLPGSPAGGQPVPSPAGVDSYRENCVYCHGVRGEGTFRGPSLVGVGEASVDYYLRSGRMPVTEPGPAPPRRKPQLPPDEIAALVAYVGGFGAGPPIPQVPTAIPSADQAARVDISRGQNLFQLNCVACHNWDGKGGAMVSSQYPVAYPLHGIPPVQVAEAVRIGPGTMPVFPPDILSEAELADLVAYVEQLDDPVDAGGYGLAHWGPATEGLAATGAIALILVVTVWLGSRQPREEAP